MREIGLILDQDKILRAINTLSRRWSPGRDILIQCPWTKETQGAIIATLFTY